MKAELATMSGVLRKIGVPIAHNETINLVLGCIRASHVYHFLEFQNFWPLQFTIVLPSRAQEGRSGVYN